MSGDGSLDPQDWAAFRALAHRALDESLDTLHGIRDGVPWKPIPPETRAAIGGDRCRRAPQDASDVYASFVRDVAPYAVDNRHPPLLRPGCTAREPPPACSRRVLAAGMNANVGGRDHAAVEVERRVIRWWCEVFGFPVVRAAFSLPDLDGEPHRSARRAAQCGRGGRSQRAACPRNSDSPATRRPKRTAPSRARSTLRA